MQLLTLINLEPMNANKILLLMFLIPIISFSQKKDAYFLLNENDSEYIIMTSAGKFTKKKLSLDFSIISIINKSNYETYENDLKKFELKLKKLGRNPTLKEFNERPRLQSWHFNVLSKKRTEISPCKIDKLKIIDFEWLKKNSWKENNPNILYKNLYFIYKIENSNYILYKVASTMVII